MAGHLQILPKEALSPDKYIHWPPLLPVHGKGTDYSSAGPHIHSSHKIHKDKVEENKLDNSGYLSYEEDPNADDGVMVAENTKGLLNGTKHYPVRTDGKKVVYLTFDDGPSTTNTPQVLDILDKYNVKATFFVLGKMLEAGNGEKDVLKDIAENGHAIA